MPYGVVVLEAVPTKENSAERVTDTAGNDQRYRDDSDSKIQRLYGDDTDPTHKQVSKGGQRTRSDLKKDLHQYSDGGKRPREDK